MCSQMASPGGASPPAARGGGGGGGGEGQQPSLESLLEASRTQEGRARLAPLLPSLLGRLRPGLPLLPALRLLRNICAGDPAAQGAFLEAGGPGAVASVVLAGGAAGAQPVPAGVARVGLQLLGNVAAAGELGQRRVWERFFPEGFLELARVRDAGACDALCMVLRSCCGSSGEGSSRGGVEELCSVGSGLPILKQVLATACSDGYQGDWLKLLLSRICFEESYFPLLFGMFSSFDFTGSEVDAECRDTLFTIEQAFLLGLLSEILSEHLCRGTIPRNFALAILQVLKEASSVVDFTSRGASPLPTGSPAIDVLGYSLTILRDICASDDFTSSASDGSVDSLVSSGLCQFLLALLRHLEPPSIIRKTLSLRTNEESRFVSSNSSKVCPYKGFRRDIVAVIGNCTCDRKHVQDEIRQQNGILLLLQQCVIDEDNPYLREWGMLTISYLLEGNMENQQQVAELELQESLDTPEIANLGLRVDVDKKSGHVKLVNI